MVAEERNRETPNLTVLPTETFLRQHGVAPGDAAFTPELLRGELTQRGWQVESEPGRTVARKAYADGGLVTLTALDPAGDTVAAFKTVLSDAIGYDEGRRHESEAPIKAHLLAQGPDGRIVLLGEVRAATAIGEEGAQHIRRTLASHEGIYAAVPYFMLVTLGDVFLWDQRSRLLPSARPSLTAPVSPCSTHTCRGDNPMTNLDGPPSSLW